MDNPENTEGNQQWTIQRILKGNQQWTIQRILKGNQQWTIQRILKAINNGQSREY